MRRSEYADLKAAALEAGWRIVKTRGGHYKCYAPDGRSIVTLPDTASDHRTYLNCRSEFRRAGLDV